ncbi:leucine-rich repeat domain-containing protein [Lentzea sp. NPDC051838]|uniref:leucine-rich repeat domain-containing protein n=1 Tax=Lentzea sp. NPDC051838 TaxID=3154849 RepID=UPI003426A187
MGDNENAPQVFTNRFGDAGIPARDSCTCLARPYRTIGFHAERQDTTAPGWVRLLELIDEAAADGRTLFKPLAEMSAEERRQVITLPATIAKLTAVEHFVLYGSNLVRIPPEIGAMTNLTLFEPYTSYRLHWFPYEITRCAKLADSTVSTRALYGNYKYRPPFPATSDSADSTDGDVRGCSVCDGPVTRLHQVWITLAVGTDYLPLLVNACSADCVAALPPPAKGYAPTPHTGGSQG